MNRSSTLLMALTPILLFLWVPLATPRPAAPVDVVERASVRLANGGGCTMIYTDGVTTYGITADHCVGQIGSTAEVFLHDGPAVSGKVVATDTHLGLALIAVQATGFEHVVSVASRPAHAKEFVTLNTRGRFELSVRWEGGSPYRLSNRKITRHRVFTVMQGLYRPGDGGTGVFQGDKLVGVVTNAGNQTAGPLVISPTLAMLWDFLAENTSRFSSTGLPALIFL